LQRSGANLLLLADNADRFPAGLFGALRYLVTEAKGGWRIFVLATGTKQVGLPDSEVVEIGPLGERHLRQLLAPLLTESLDPNPVLTALQRASGGNPLWVRLLLASWIDSGRLRLVQGRPYFDESMPAQVPATIEETVRALVAKLTSPERGIVEAMAVWGRPLSRALAAKLVPGPLAVPPTLAIADPSGTLRFVSDTFGSLILEALPSDRRQSWHGKILVAFEGEEVEPGLRAFHLLGSGRSAEAVRDFISGARQAASSSSLHTALDYYRISLANLEALKPGEMDRGALTLEAARVAIRIGEYIWAGEALERVEVPAGGAVAEARLHLDLLLARAHVLREQGNWEEAAQLYGNARELAQRVPALKGQEVLVDLEEAKNDFLSGNYDAGEKRLAPALPRLENAGSPALFAAALNRLATLRSHGDVKGATLLALRAARLARSLGDHLLAAMAFSNVGSFYQRLGLATRALKALERCRGHLAVCPHDGIKAAELLPRGSVLMSLGRLEEADKVLLLARAVRLRNANRRGLVPCLIQLGRIRRHMGRLEEAIGFYSEALEIAESLRLPEAHVARANLGELCLYQGEYHQAERLLRQSFADERPFYRALNLKNLGVLLRKLGKPREALAVLSEVEELFARHLPQQRPLAVIEVARVALEVGDVEGALVRLAGIPEATESADLEVRAAFHLARGLCLARRNEDPYGALDLAAGAARALNDPTLHAEVLAESLGGVLELQTPEAAWVRQKLGSLAEVVSQTDARPAVKALDLLRERVAARFPTPAPSAQLAEDFAGTVLTRAEGSVDLMLRHLIEEVQGARGAVVVAIAVGPDGTLGVSPVPRALKPEVGVVRPYRVAARDFDRQVFRQALAATKGNVPRAARLLRLPESTFRYRAGRLGLLRREKRGSSSNTS
jgi:tetratricopeptide (TPR) repeat protein